MPDVASQDSLREELQKDKNNGHPSLMSQSSGLIKTGQELFPFHMSGDIYHSCSSDATGQMAIIMASP